MVDVKHEAPLDLSAFDTLEPKPAGQSHVIEFFAVGTAVLPLEKAIAPEKIPDPIMVLSVND